MSNDVYPHFLIGKKLGDWRVTQDLDLKNYTTGGNFSWQFAVVNDVTGEGAFLKAVNLYRAADSENAIQETSRILKELTDFNYEAELHKLCGDRKMRRITRVLHSGVYEEKFAEVPGMAFIVPYLIFELAEGDIRSHDAAQVFNLSWRLRIFHGVACALQQLHTAEIAHQDLKPSNIVIFERDYAKLTDLGRATRLGDPGAFASDRHAGDRNYIPFELLYNHFTRDSWEERRLGADFFMLGCILTFLLTEANFLVLVFSRLPKPFWPHNWKGSYEEVTPYIQHAVGEAFQELDICLPEPILSEAKPWILRLCHPDLKQRGFPQKCISENRWSSDADKHYLRQFDLQQVISMADRLAKCAAFRNLAAKASKERQGFLGFFMNGGK